MKKDISEKNPKNSQDSISMKNHHLLNIKYISKVNNNSWDLPRGNRWPWLTAKSIGLKKKDQSNKSNKVAISSNKSQKKGATLEISTPGTKESSIPGKKSPPKDPNTRKRCSKNPNSIWIDKEDGLFLILKVEFKKEIIEVRVCWETSPKKGALDHGKANSWTISVVSMLDSFLMVFNNYNNDGNRTVCKD